MTRISPQKIFLIDGVGGLSTAICLYFGVGRFEKLFGMPPDVVNQLAMLGLGFASYSLGCWLLVGPRWRPFLMAVAVANLAYCLLTGVLIVRYFSSLRAWGLGYFVLEITVIVILVLVELSLLFNSDPKQHTTPTTLR